MCGRDQSRSMLTARHKQREIERDEQKHSDREKDSEERLEDIGSKRERDSKREARRESLEERGTEAQRETAGERNYVRGTVRTGFNRMNQHTPTELRCAPVPLETSAAQDSSSSKEYPYVRSQSSATFIASCRWTRGIGRLFRPRPNLSHEPAPSLFCGAPRKPRSIRGECYPRRTGVCPRSFQHTVCQALPVFFGEGEPFGMLSLQVLPGTGGQSSRCVLEPRDSCSSCTRPAQRHRCRPRANR